MEIGASRVGSSHAAAHAGSAAKAAAVKTPACAATIPPAAWWERYSPNRATPAELSQHAPLGAVRAGHPLAQGRRTVQRYAASTHAAMMQRGRETSAVDDALAQRGVARTIALTVPSSYAALVVAARSDFVATASERIARAMAPALGLVVFELPFELPPERQLMAWHPRHGADPAHRQLRTVVQSVLGRAPRRPLKAPG